MNFKNIIKGFDKVLVLKHLAIWNTTSNNLFFTI